MKIASVAAALLALSSFAGCNTRTPIGEVEPDSGAPGSAGTAGKFVGGAGSGGAAGVVGGVAGGPAGGPGCPTNSSTARLFLATTPLPYPSDSIPTALALGDLNGDDVDDIVIGGRDAPPPPPLSGSGGMGAGGANGSTVSSGSLEVALTDEAGGFAPLVRYADDDPSVLAVADLDGNKTLDLAAVSFAGLETRLNAGSGALGALTAYSLLNITWAFAIGDLDGDGKAEMVFSPSGDGQGIEVVKSLGGAMFTAQAYDQGFTPSGVAIGEVDGSPGVDVVVVGPSGVQVLSNDGTGHLGAPKTVGGPMTTVALADVDGDGKLDIVGIDSYVYGYSVLINLGGGVFALARRLSLGDGNTSAVFADVDGDGKVDAVVSSFNCSSLVIYSNDGKGSFGAPSFVPGMGAANGFALGDVNGDKLPDLVFFTPTSVGVRFHEP